MKHKYLDKIKSLEGPPKKVNIFSEKEIEMFKELYELLPERTYNKKQKIRKKAWEKNYNKELDKIYYSKLKEVLGDYKMDNLKSKTGEDFFGLFWMDFHRFKYNYFNHLISKILVNKTNYILCIF